MRYPNALAALAFKPAARQAGPVHTPGRRPGQRSMTATAAADRFWISLARPHTLALAAALALPATVGAQVNSFNCAGGGWTGDTACWSLGQTANASHDVVINGGPADNNLMLLFAIGNNIAARSVTLGTNRPDRPSSATAQLYLSGTTLTVGSSGAAGPAGTVNVGTGTNANAELNLTNRSWLNLIAPPIQGSGTVNVGTVSGFLPETGIGALTVQGDARISGLVNVNRGQLDVLGSSTPGYVAIDGQARIGGGTSQVLATANIASSVGAVVVFPGGRATLGTTNTEFQTPFFDSVSLFTSISGGNIDVDFMGRSSVRNLSLNANQGTGVSTATIKSGATVGISSGGVGINRDGVLRLESGAVLSSTGTGFGIGNQGLIQIAGGTINHQGVVNVGTVSGFGVINSVSESQAFTHQSGAFLRASGGDLVIGGHFDGKAGGAIETTANGRLFFYGNADFKAGQLITQGPAAGDLLVFGRNVEIGTAAERGALGAMTVTMALQSSSNLFLDFGSGGAADHDYLSTAGNLLLEGGTLTLRTADSFQAGVGSVYNIFRGVGTIFGTFSTVNSSSFSMAPGAWLDLSNLYTTGTVAVVPEPATWLSLGMGLLLISARARRWSQQA